MNPPNIPSNVPQKTSQLAITSLVLGILGVGCCGLFLGIPAAICGHIARSRINASGGTLSGGGLALAGLILGYLSLFTTAIGSALLAPAVAGAANAAKAAQALNEERQIFKAVQNSELWPADNNITSVRELADKLVEKGVLSREDAATLHFEHFQIANASGSDPGSTIFIRTKPDLLKLGTNSVFYMDGSGHVFRRHDPPKGTAPARTPQYLAD